MKKLKVVSVVGTRPEIIRLSRVLARLDEYCNHVIVHTGQNYDYELNQVFFDDLGIRKPDYFLNCAVNSASAANTIGNLITAVDQVLADIQPGAMLVLGDTNVACLSFPLSGGRFPSSIWKQETVALISASQKRRIVGL